MPISTCPGLSRRGFFAVGTGVWLAFAARPMRARVSKPDPALAFDGDDLVVASSRICRYDVNSNSQQEWSAPGIIRAVATHPDRPGLIVAGFASGAISISENGGQNWESRTAGLPGGAIDAVTIAAGNPDLLYAAVRSDGIWKSEDAGQSWAFAMDRPWLNEAEHDALTLASVNLETGMGGIWIYAGTGAGLTRVPDCFCRWQDVQPGDAMDALVSGKAPPPESSLPKGEPVRVLATAPSAPGTLYAAMPSGLWNSTDGGVVWSHLAKGPAGTVAVHPENADLLAALIDGHLKLSRDGGANWAAITAS